MRIFSESPLDRRDHTNRLSCHIIHEFRFSRTIFALPHAVASARAKVASTTRPVPSREFPASTRPPRSRAPCPRSARRIARESSSPARRLSPGCAPPPMRPNLPSEGSAPRQRAGKSGSYDPPRAFTVIFRVHSTATVARTVPSLGASYCTRIFVSRASAFARLRAAASAQPGESGSFRRVAVQRDPRLLVLALQRLEHAHRHEQPHDVGGIRLRVEALKRIRIRLWKEARGRKRLLRPAPRLHGNLPRPLDCHGRANRALARRIILHANLRLPRVGLRAAVRRRQCARIRRRKEARHASVRAKTTSTTRPAPSR